MSGAGSPRAEQRSASDPRPRICRVPPTGGFATVGAVGIGVGKARRQHRSSQSGCPPQWHGSASLCRRSARLERGDGQVGQSESERRQGDRGPGEVYRFPVPATPPL